MLVKGEGIKQNETKTHKQQQHNKNLIDTENSMEITRGGRKGYRVWGINVLVATCMNMDEFHNIIKEWKKLNFFFLQRV